MAREVASPADDPDGIGEEPGRDPSLDRPDMDAAVNGDIRQWNITLERQYKEAPPRSQREILNQFNAEQGKIAEQQRALAQSEKARSDWSGQNEETIKGLSPEWQSRIHGSGSLPEAQAMFDRGMQERQEATRFSQVLPPPRERGII